MQGFYLPEWSHMTRAEAERFTAVFYGIIEENFWHHGRACGSGPARNRCQPVRAGATGSGGVLYPAARLAVEAQLHVDGFLAAAAAKALHDVRDRLVPAARAVPGEECRRHFTRVPAACR